MLAPDGPAHTAEIDVLSGAFDPEACRKVLSKLGVEATVSRRGVSVRFEDRLTADAFLAGALAFVSAEAVSAGCRVRSHTGGSR